MSFHSTQHVGEGRPVTPLTPTVVKDNMSFAELCESFKDYCTFPISYCHVLVSIHGTTQPLTDVTQTVIENIDTPQNLSTLKLSPVTTRLCSQLTDKGRAANSLRFSLIACVAHFAYG